MTVAQEWSPRAQQININLKRGGKFRRLCEFRTKSGELWVPPEGTTVVLAFGPEEAPIETWSAAVDGSTFTFARTVAQVLASSAVLPEGTPVQLLVTFPPDSEPDVRAKGRVFW